MHQQFWKNFTNLNWEKRPALFKNFKSSVSELSEEQIFSMLVMYSDQCRKLKNPDGFKLFVDGQRLHDAEILQILPTKSDKNFIGYHQKMEKIFSDYCLVCDELLQSSQDYWKKLTEFTNTLFSYVGMPNRFVEIGLYIGNYKKTPFGVHADGCGVFSFPVVGQKKFRLWSPEFVHKNPTLDRAKNYTKFKKNSQIFNARVGDMTYWPSSAWHIAESDGSFSATWSLGVWVDQPFQETLLESLRPLLVKKMGSMGSEKLINYLSAEKNGQILKLPKNYLSAISTVQKISKNEFYDTFLRSWVQHNSRSGFKTRPALKAQKQFSFQSRLQIKNSQTIFWAPLKSEKKVIYGFSGRLIEATPSLEFLKLIQDLNLSRICLVSEYLRGAGKQADLKILNQLLIGFIF